MRPDKIILGTADAILEFKKTLQSLSLADELDIADVVNYMFDYLVDEANASGNVLEFANSVSESFTNRYSENDLSTLLMALCTLGTVMHELLKNFRLYDEDKTCWYGYGELCGNDVVIRKITKEDLVD